MQISEEQGKVLLDIARRSIAEALRGNFAQPTPASDDPLLNMPCGCFVSLHERNTHRLRGCIGRLQTSDPLIKTIHETAQSSLQDPRFRYDPITADELSRLELEISILSPLAPADSPLDFDPLNDGIYLICNGRSGTFLPQVARQTGWGREQLLARLCTEKMGLPPEAWREPAAKLLKYQASIIGPVPFAQLAGGVAAATPASPPAASTAPAATASIFGPNQVMKL